MDFLKGKRRSYEVLGPKPPQRGQHKCLNTIISVLLLAIAGIITAVLVMDLFRTQPSSTEASILRSRVLGQSAGVLVDLDQGQLRGKSMTSRGGREYLAFTGVPYAKPPLGGLRFAPPEAAEPWNGTYDATDFKPQCIQLYKDRAGNVGPSGSEDCLYLNIYTPKKASELTSRGSRFPVMVYIHGGINNGNSSQYGADYFMDENVVLVMVHYRLHVFGHLNTGDSVARGNFCVKDQVLALRWVQDNIAKFGGNRRKVTLFGNSSGAMQVSIHTVSPMSRGLFQYAIHQSGTIIFPNRVSRTPRASVDELGQELGCPTADSQELVDCLRRLDAGLLTTEVRDIDFIPSVEAGSEEPEADTCIPDEPLKLLRAGKVNPVTSIYGVNSAEYLLYALETLLLPNNTRAINEAWDEYVGDRLELDYAKDPQAITSVLRDFYIGPGRNVTGGSRDNLTNLFSDRFYVHPARVFADYAVQHKGTRNSVYLYYLSKPGPLSYASTPMQLYDPTDTDFGATHADEVQFLFPNGKFPRIEPGSAHFNFSQMMVRIWVNFANTGVPTGASNGAEWTELGGKESAGPAWYNLDDEPKMFDPVKERMGVWDSFDQADLYV